MQNTNRPTLGIRPSTERTPPSAPNINKVQEDLARLAQQKESLEKRLGAVGAEVDDRGPIERLFNFRQNQGALGNIFEALDRPGQAIKGAFIGAQEGDLIGGAWQGLSGELDIRGAEFLKEMGMITERDFDQMGGVEKFVVNLIVDRIFDPLRWMPKGSFANGLKAVNQKIGAMIAGKASGNQLYQGLTAQKLMLASEDFASQVEALATASNISLEDASVQVLDVWKSKGFVLEEGSKYLDQISLDVLDEKNGKTIA
jgi:hypothetical protein